MEKTRDLFKKIRDTKGTFHAKMGAIQDRNGMELTETEAIKKRWQDHTKELHGKDLNGPDDHDGVISLLEPDILECKVDGPWKASLQTKLLEVMEFQLSYFKSKKTMLLKCCTQYANKFGRLSSGRRTGKGQSSFQSQRAMPRIFSYHIIVLISHASKIRLKILQARLQQYMNLELPDVQAEFGKGREIRDQIVNIHWIIAKRKSSRKNIYFCFVDYAKDFDYVDHNKLENS